MTDEFVIEKGVPLPGKGQKTGLTATMRRMEVGDSFLMSTAKRTSFYGTASHLKPKKFMLRAIGDHQARIWRIE